jgi:hypothetical protein
MKKKNKYKIGSLCKWNGFDCKIRSAPLKNGEETFIIIEYDDELEYPERYDDVLTRKARVPIEEINVRESSNGGSSGP